MQGFRTRGRDNVIGPLTPWAASVAVGEADVGELLDGGDVERVEDGEVEVASEYGSHVVGIIVLYGAPLVYGAFWAAEGKTVFNQNSS